MNNTCGGLKGGGETNVVFRTSLSPFDLSNTKLAKQLVFWETPTVIFWQNWMSGDVKMTEDQVGVVDENGNE